MAKGIFKSIGRSLKKFGRTKSGKGLGRTLRAMGKIGGHAIDKMIKSQLSKIPLAKELYKAVKPAIVKYAGRKTGLAPRRR